MGKPKVIVLRTAGTNCDQETAFSFKTFGAEVDVVHVNDVLAGRNRLGDYHILAVPGGFSYGDDIESGRILANEIRLKLGDDLRRFIQDGKLMIGICNGFQVLAKAGVLPGPSTGGEAKTYEQTATLTNNDSGKYEDRWVHLRVEGDSIWTKGLKKIVYFPVAHAEGKFIPKSDAILESLGQNHQVAFRYSTADGKNPKYPENPNGSTSNIAGITDRTGRILGLMPHPERHFLFIHHPFWTRLTKKERFGDGAKIFENGVHYVKENLLA